MILPRQRPKPLDPFKMFWTLGCPDEMATLGGTRRAYQGLSLLVLGRYWDVLPLDCQMLMR